MEVIEVAPGPMRYRAAWPGRRGQPHGAGMMQAKVFDDDRSLGDQRLGGLEVDQQFVFGRRLSRWF